MEINEIIAHAMNSHCACTVVRELRDYGIDRLKLELESRQLALETLKKHIESMQNESPHDLSEGLS